jgi:hypothetical protein
VLNEEFHARTLPVEGGSVRVFQRIASVREIAGGDRERAGTGRAGPGRSTDDPTAFEREAMGRPGSDDMADVRSSEGGRARSAEPDRAHAANRPDESDPGSRGAGPDGLGRGGGDKPTR